METFFLALVGCFAGFLVSSKFGVFLAVLLIERRSALASRLGTGPTYAALAMHSGPWLLLGTITFLVLFVRASEPPAWSYTFVAGFCAGPVCYATLLTWALLRAKAKGAGRRQA